MLPSTIVTSVQPSRAVLAALAAVAPAPVLALPPAGMPPLPAATAPGATSDRWGHVVDAPMPSVTTVVCPTPPGEEPVRISLPLGGNWPGH